MYAVAYVTVAHILVGRLAER